MFLHLSVILSTVGGVWGVPPGRHPPGQTPHLPLGTHPLLWADTPRTDTPGQTATAVDGTHPTGMHSCYFYIIKIKGILIFKLSILFLT